MTDKILALADALDTLPLAVSRALVGVVQSFGEFLLDYNRAYLADGLRPDGQPVDANGYSEIYKKFREKFNKQVRVKDLNFTGEYYKRFHLDYLGGLRFEVGNLDPKAAKLLSSYGELYGVRESDIEDFIITYLLPEVEQVILEHMRV